MRKLDRPWLRASLEAAKLQGELQRLSDIGDVDWLVDYAIQTITTACDASMSRRKNASNAKKAVYWWNTEINELRKTYLSARRAA